MIVDDMEIMRRELKRLKVWGEETGFVVSEEAKDGQDAIKKLKKQKVDLVITDIKMPGADGIDLLKKIIDEQLCYCVVLLSEYSEFEYARQGIVYGAFDYIVKPINEEKMRKLLLKVAKYIGKKKLEKERVKKLENELEEKVEIFYSPEDVEKIIKLFKDVDVKVIEAASNLVDTIGAAVDYDSLKVAYVLNRITSTLVESLKEVYPWLEKLVFISKYTDIDFTNVSKFSNMKTTFLKIIRELFTTISKFQFGSEMNSMVRNICKIVLDRIDTEVSVKIIADEMFLNQSYLSTLYKEKTGKSLVEYITMVKMERAKILFHDSNIKNYEIASKLGYKDVEYFGKLFKKYTGMTPSKFKASCTAGENG
jgi:two-component system response regulator YesN